MTFYHTQQHCNIINNKVEEPAVNKRMLSSISWNIIENVKQCTDL